jgi:hypothetical protein
MSEKEKSMADYREQARTQMDLDLINYYCDLERLEQRKQEILTRLKNGEISTDYVYIKERTQLDHKIAETYIKAYSLDVPTTTITKVDWKREVQIKAVLAENNLPVPDQIIKAYFKRRSERDE